MCKAYYSNCRGRINAHRAKIPCKLLVYVFILEPCDQAQSSGSCEPTYYPDPKGDHDQCGSCRKIEERRNPSSKFEQPAAYRLHTPLVAPTEHATPRYEAPTYEETLPTPLPQAHFSAVPLSHQTRSPSIVDIDPTEYYPERPYLVHNRALRGAIFEFENDYLGQTRHRKRAYLIASPRYNQAQLRSVGVAIAPEETDFLAPPPISNTQSVNMNPNGGFYEQCPAQRIDIGPQIQPLQNTYAHRQAEPFPLVGQNWATNGAINEPRQTRTEPRQPAGWRPSSWLRKASDKIRGRQTERRERNQRSQSNLGPSRSIETEPSAEHTRGRAFSLFPTSSLSAPSTRRLAPRAMPHPRFDLD